MRAYDIIYKKRQGKEHTEGELKYLVNGYVKEEIPDYQIAAWAMAVYFQGMTARETSLLTGIMADSGEQIDLSSIPGFKADKHSTGGVGDKTTLVLIPLLAAAGLPMAKMSGRGLGHTGGTIDKLESIPGFKTEFSRQKFIEKVKKAGACVAGHSGNLAPADQKFYSLRDVTATVDSIPLIASSIMSKKIAGGADGIILDVKMGHGAFMEDLEEARNLAQTMVEIGKNIGRKTRAVITDMDQPLGKAVGNSLEVKEAISVLRGQGPADVRKLCLELGSHVLLMAEMAGDRVQAEANLRELLDSGQALTKFKEIIRVQDGDSRVIENAGLLPEADYKYELKSNKTGFIAGVNARAIGLVSMDVGAGREQKGEEIDDSVGVVLKKKRGQEVKKGETLAVLHVNKPGLKEEVWRDLKNSFTIKSKKPAAVPLVYEVIGD